MFFAVGETERKVFYISWHNQQTDDHFVLKVTEHTKQQLQYYRSSRLYFIHIRPLGLQRYFTACIAVFHLARLFLFYRPAWLSRFIFSSFLSHLLSLFLMKLFLLLMLFTIVLHSSRLSPDLLLDLVLVKVGTRIGSFGLLHLWPVSRFGRCSSLKTAVRAHPSSPRQFAFLVWKLLTAGSLFFCSLFLSCFCLKAH